MIPKVDNYDHKQSRADIKESADVPKQSISLLGVALYLHTFIISRASRQTLLRVIADG